MYLLLRKYSLASIKLVSRGKKRVISLNIRHKNIKYKVRNKMSTYNAAGEILSNPRSEHFDRANATFIVPSTTSSLLEPYSTSHFSTQTPFIHEIQKNLSSTSHHTNTSSSSYTFVQIKREPCQVSEVTTSNNCHQQTSSKTMSSTLTTLVKIESSSPKVSELEKSVQIANTSKIYKYFLKV